MVWAHMIFFVKGGDYKRRDHKRRDHKGGDYKGRKAVGQTVRLWTLVPYAEQYSQISCSSSTLPVVRFSGSIVNCCA